MSKSTLLAGLVFLLLAGALPGQIDLTDVTAGGDGSGNAPAENVGLDQRNGRFVTTADVNELFAAGTQTLSEFDTDLDGNPLGDDVNPSPVEDSPYVDSVFIIGPPEDLGGDVHTQVVTQDGVEFEFPLEDAAGVGWNFILRNPNSAAGEWGSAPGTEPTRIGGGTVDAAVGIHAAAGITYDLNALRETHGAANVRHFLTYHGLNECSCGDLRLYVILSSETQGVLDDRSFSAGPDEATFLSLPIPDEAAYLTLATGSNGELCCDQGVFGNPVIASAAPAAGDLVVSPASVRLVVGGSVQLEVTSTNDLGFTEDLTASGTGTTYGVDPPGVVTVSADGRVTASALGEATITITNAGRSVMVPVVVGGPEFIDLGDVTAGGSGVGDAPPENIGIDQRNGRFVQSPADPRNVSEGDFEADGIIASPVEDSDFIDSVFILSEPGFGDDPYTQIITDSGVEFELPLADAYGQAWNFIVQNPNASDGDWGNNPGAGNQEIRVGGEVVSSGVGIHAAAGITYDLGALRAHYGAELVKTFTTFWGLNSCGCGDLNLYAILSNDTGGVLEWETLHALPDDGELLQMELPDEAEYLTLITGSNGEWCCDQGTFGLAKISKAVTGNEELVSLVLSPDGAQVVPGSTLQLKAEGENTIGLPTDVTAAASGTTYGAEPPGIVTVSVDGLVTGVAVGDATVTATNGALSASVSVKVVDLADVEHIDLADVTAGGAGIGNAPRENIGIDSRNGMFATSPIAGPLNETDPEGDGLDPSPVAGSPLIDSVFILGPVDGFDDTYTQLLTQDGVEYEFPLEDAAGAGWNHILKNPNGTAGAWGSAPGAGTVNVGGLPFDNAVGIHASAGITYDLREMRRIYGADRVQCLSTFWGMNECDCGDINLYAILSSSTGGVLVERSSRFLPNEAAKLELAIPDEAEYLTFATGAANGDVCCDQGHFARPWIGALSLCQLTCVSLEVEPSVTLLAPAETLQLRVNCRDENDLPADVTASASGTTYGADPAGVVTIDENGLVTAVGEGEVTITAANGNLTATARVVVAEDQVVALSVAPQEASLLVGQELQLSVVGENQIGVRTDLTPELSGTTYSVDPGGVVSVDFDGLVSAEAAGRATVTAANGNLTASTTITVIDSGEVINLADVTAGGDGTGSAPLENIGVDQRNGAFVTVPVATTVAETDPEGDGLNPSPVDGSPFIDSVFILGPPADGATVHTQTLTQGGNATFDFPLVDAFGAGWNFILKDPAGSGGAFGQDFGPPIFVGGREVQTAVGIHGASGITYDLDALREELGPESVGTFTTFWGMNDCAGGDVNLYAILSDDGGVLESASFHATTAVGQSVSMAIPDGARYLTLATGTNGANGCDQGLYADAFILPKAPPPGGTKFVRADANADGTRNLTDGIFVLNFLFAGGGDPPCEDSADSNDDGVHNITDAVHILNFLFGGGMDPPPPFPECGVDETDDALGCAEFPCA